jgi:hypothetical protein
MIDTESALSTAAQWLLAGPPGNRIASVMPPDVLLIKAQWSRMAPSGRPQRLDHHAKHPVDHGQMVVPGDQLATICP